MATGDEHRVKGRLQQVKGAIKEGFGALTGRRETEVEGKGERAAGALREGYGELKNDLTGDVSADEDLNKPRRP